MLEEEFCVASRAAPHLQAPKRGGGEQRYEVAHRVDVGHPHRSIDVGHLGEVPTDSAKSILRRSHT